MFSRYQYFSLATVLIALNVSGCGPSKHSAAARDLGASITVDGSSTVFPITEAVAEEFGKHGHGHATVGLSGTGGGFKKFCHGEIAVTGASRPIKPSEVKLCRSSNIEYIELPVAYDGLTVVVNPKNNWVDSITVDELKRLWEPRAQGKIKKWNDLRANWPDKEIHLFGAGVDSGTYDYFTAAIVGQEHASRGDFNSSEDDNVLVQGISRDTLALGFFGYAYYSENKDKLRAVPVDDGNPNNGNGPIYPSVKTVNNGTYQPLSRPIFIYVAKNRVSQPAVKSFIEFYLQQAPILSEEVGYIPFPADTYQLVRHRFATQVVGSMFAGKGSQVGVSLNNLLSQPY